MFKQENSKTNEHRKPPVARLNGVSRKSGVHAARSWFVQAAFPELVFQSREGFNTLVELLWECENRFRDWEEKRLQTGETFTTSLPFQAGESSRLFVVTHLRSQEQALQAEKLFRRAAIKLAAVTAQIMIGETTETDSRIFRSCGLASTLAVAV